MSSNGGAKWCRHDARVVVYDGSLQWLVYGGLWWQFMVVYGVEMRGKGESLCADFY